MKKQLLYFLAAIALSLVTWFLASGLGTNARIVAAIIVFIATLWFTEALPLWVTAISVPFLLIVLAGISPSEAFTPFFDPIIALLLGGLVLGYSIQKLNLAKRISDFFINVFGTKSKWFLLGIMLATAFLSFWMPNTASAALLMPIGLAAIAATRLKQNSNFSKALVLGIGFAATIGGIATPVGTPPNLITIRWLADSGITVDFLGWMARALPLVLIMLFLAWLSLIILYKPEVPKIKSVQHKWPPLNRDQKILIAVFIATVLLWLTESIHKIHNSAIAMLPILAFYGAKILKTEDLKKFGWDVLILIGGGLSLGVAITATGLDKVLANGMASVLGGYSPYFLFLILGLFAIVFTAFLSNTGAAAILIPIMLPLAVTLGINPLPLALLIGMVVSFDFIVPVGTPPNAIAYGTGKITVMDMVKAGLVLSILGAVIIAGFALIW